MTVATFGPLSNYIDLLLDTICVVDEAGRFVYVSAGCEKVFGYSQEEMVGRQMTDMLHPDDLEITLRKANEVMQGEPLPYFENRYIRKDGSIAHIMWSARWAEEDKLRVAVARDISGRIRAEARQRATFAISEAAHSTQDLQELFDLIRKIVVGLIPVDSFSITLYNHGHLPEAGASSVVAYTYPATHDTRETVDPRHQLAHHILATNTSLMTHIQADPTGIANWIGVPLKAQTQALGAVLASRNDGHQNFSEPEMELLHFVSAQIAAAVERHQMMTRLHHLALYDSLTGLPNRSLFEDRMRLALARARRRNAMLSLLYIDLDRFKEVNDKFGHAIGDLLLSQVARRLEGCLRECDTVARLSGDEFVILLENVTHQSHVSKVSDKIRSSLMDEFHLESHRTSIGLSIGSALYPEHGKDMHSLMRHADGQMYKVKSRSDTGNRS
ncbi:MAG: diguanylate cyclase [Pseudohongiella sp.]|nr:diguanylate cyclase [Pseudohongiella sp.]MDO9521253.1 diguanylate cyclase [Pseudohongiella sp.]MDP2127290.1 diguanylate cyclase [Pseudohongiella sp.]